MLYIPMAYFIAESLYPFFPLTYLLILPFSPSVLSIASLFSVPTYEYVCCLPIPCPLSWWCHPTIPSSVVPFSSCPQSFLASGSFQMSQLFASGGQSIGLSALTSGLPKNTQDWYPLGWIGWISLQSKGLSKESSPTPQFKSINSSALSFLHSPTLTSVHDHWKNQSLD